MGPDEGVVARRGGGLNRRPADPPRVVSAIPLFPVTCVSSSRAAPVAQLDRVLASEAKGHRFESCRARHPFGMNSTP